MSKLNSLFTLHIAKSHAYKGYEKGKTAFVSNGLSNNGVLGYITPKSGDRVFTTRSICVSAFCEATVQEPPFVARGNGGSGLVILEPKTPTSRRGLLGIAAYINKVVRWRFSYGRMVTPDRLAPFDIPEYESVARTDVGNILPKIKDPKVMSVRDFSSSLNPIALTDLFVLKSGDYHKATDLPNGSYPLISCGDKDNGLVRYCKAPSHHIYENCLTVAYNGSPMTTKYHPYKFVAKDDVAVLVPRQPLRSTTVLFIQIMLLRETWRYSYGRKCFRAKLMRVAINLPVMGGDLDEDSMEEVLRCTTYWDFVQPRVRHANPVAQNETEQEEASGLA